MEQDSIPEKRDVILASVQHYRFEHLKPFLVSLKKTGYSGDVVFFCHDVDPATLSQLEDTGVQIIKVYNWRFRMGPRVMRGIMNRISKLYYLVRWPFFDRYWHVLLSGVKQRYYLYYHFLLQNGHKYKRALLTDVRDVFFQKDPFDDYSGQDLVFFEEDKRRALKTGLYNPVWMLRVFGQPTLDRLGDKVTICSGTTMGTPVALLDYLERYLRLLKTSKNLQSVDGEDQAVHNVLVYENMTECPFSIFISPNDHGPVYTVGMMPVEDIKISADHDVLFPDGRVAPIVHQYDRHPTITKEFCAKVGAA